MRLGSRIISRVIRGLRGSSSTVIISCGKLAIRRMARLEGGVERTNIRCGMCGGALIEGTTGRINVRRFGSRLLIKAGTVTFKCRSPITPTEVLGRFVSSRPGVRLGVNMMRNRFCGRSRVIRFTGVPSERILLTGLLKDLGTPVSGFTCLVSTLVGGRRKRRTWLSV